jgi:hypothetical protein
VEFELSRLEVEEAHRPVLIPVSNGANTHYDPTPPRTKLIVPIKNIGSGPALDVRVAVTPRNDAGERSDAWGDRTYSATALGIAVSEFMGITIDVPKLGDLPNFDVWLTYADVAGKVWTTSAKFVKRDDSGVFEDMSITSGSVDRFDTAV